MGWRTVKEYDINPLVEDSDDEKRLIRAESRAKRKAKQQKMKKSQRRFTPAVDGRLLQLVLHLHM